MKAEQIIETVAEKSDEKFGIRRYYGDLSGEQTFDLFGDGSINFRYDENTDTTAVKLLITLMSDAGYSNQFSGQRQIKFTPNND